MMPYFSTHSFLEAFRLHSFTLFISLLTRISFSCPLYHHNMRASMITFFTCLVYPYRHLIIESLANCRIQNVCRILSENYALF